MTKEINEREIALDILMEILEKGGFSHLVLSQALSKYQYLEKQERSFITRVVEGTLEYKIQIDYVLDSCSKVKTKKMKPLIRTLMRMSVYQILYMDRVPDSAACNEAVKLAVKRRFQGLKGFVNGVLRAVARKKEEFSWPNLSVKYSVPQWMADMWIKEWGEDQAEKIMKALLENRDTTVRCNFHLASREEIIHSLREQGVEIEVKEELPHLIYLKQYDYLEGLNAFLNGWIQVQDMSSSLVGLTASPKENSYIIDVCGAPGGKSLHLADMMKGTGFVDVRDLSPQKIELIEENIERTGFSNIHTKVWDALERDESVLGKADILIADLPCSGLGIIGRKPDIKYNTTAESVESLAALQREILSVVQEYVKPGGLLVYSTCTVAAQENQENARWFQEHFPFSLVSLKDRLGHVLKAESLEQGYVQILPGQYNCDGFFISLFRREN